jgi:CheY-like chemotaxis protein
MKILVLDADDGHATQLVRGLEERACEVVREQSGVTGLVRAVSERFDAVVVAADLPESNGFRVCSRIKKDASVESSLVFLMGTHATAQFDSHRRLPTRADGYLQQPVHAEALLAQIVAACSGRSEPAVRHKGGTLAALRGAIAARDRADPPVLSGVIAADTPPDAEAAPADAPQGPDPVEKTLAMLKRELTDALESAAELKTELVVARSRSRAVEQLLTDRERDLAEVDRRATSARSEREATDRRIEDLEKRLQGAEESLEEALSLLADKTQTETGARAALARLRDEMAEKHRAEVEAVEERWSAQLDGFMKDVENTVAGWREAQGRAERRVRALLKANRELDERLARATSELETLRSRLAEGNLSPTGEEAQSSEHAPADDRVIAIDRPADESNAS